MKKIFISWALFSCFQLFGQKELYELRVYELFQTSSFKDFNTYFKDYFIPALDNMGIENIGVFEEVSQDLPRKIYVFIPYQNIEKYQEVMVATANDSKMQEASVTLNPVGKPMFNRYDTSLYIAFDGMQRMVRPDENNRFFELRTYESHSEEAYKRKVDMFNEGELDLFEALDFGTVFFGDKIAGDRMPSMTYMLSFETLEERNSNWDLFFNHPTWAKLLNDPAYKDNCCSSISRVFLTPLEYSQL